MDSRELPVSYGPPQLPDQAQRIRDALGGMDPEMAHFAQSIGSNIKNRGNLDFVMRGAFMGQSPQDLAEHADAEDAAKEAMRIAQDSMRFSDQQFEQVVGQMRSETQNPTPMPQRQPAQNVSPWQAGLTLLGLVTDPKHAYDIGAAPFVANQRTADQAFGDQIDQYQMSERNRSERINQLRYEAEAAQQRRGEALTEVRTIARQMAAEAERKRSEGKNVEAALFELRSNAYGADDLHKLASAQKGIDDLIAKYPEYANYALHSDEMMGLRSQIESVQKEKLTAQSAKDEQNRVEKVVDNFRAWVTSQYPSGSTIGPNDVKHIESEAARYAKENGIDVARLPKYTTRVNEGLERQKTRDIISDSHWQKSYDLSVDREKRIATEAAKPKASPEQKAKAKRLESFNETIDKSRATWGVLMSAAPDTSADEEAFKKLQARQEQILIEYRTARRQKDALLGIKRKKGYYETAQPDGTWGPIPLLGSNDRMLTDEVSIESGPVQPGPSRPLGTGPIGGSAKPKKKAPAPSGSKYSRGPNGEVIRR